MLDRWRGRTAGLAIGAVALSALLTLGAGGLEGTAQPYLVARDSDGAVLVTRPVAEGDLIGLRYRNSLYRSIAEEWFVVTGDGRLRLEEVSGDELAVLEEYYEIDGPARSDGGPSGERSWTARPAIAVELNRLHVAATDLGERAILIGDEDPVDLWRLVDDERPTVTLAVEGGG